MDDPVLFGNYIGEIVQAASRILKKEAISGWLVKPVSALDNMSVIEFVWKFGESGRDRVIQVLHNLEEWNPA